MGIVISLFLLVIKWMLQLLFWGFAFVDYVFLFITVDFLFSGSILLFDPIYDPYGFNGWFTLHPGVSFGIAFFACVIWFGILLLPFIRWIFPVAAIGIASWFLLIPEFVPLFIGETLDTTWSIVATIIAILVLSSARFGATGQLAEID